MTKSKAAAAAVSSKSKRYKKGDPISYHDQATTVEGPIISDNGNPASLFHIILEMLCRINRDCQHYNYQVCLQPNQELYEGIGTFSTLFDLDQTSAFLVLKEADLVGVDKNSKPFFKSSQWDLIAQHIPGFSWVKNYGRKQAFIFGIGCKGEKLSMAIQYKAKRGECKFSRSCRQRQEEFNQKWKEIINVSTANEETSSLPDENAQLFQVSDDSSQETPWLLHLDDDMSEGDTIVRSQKRRNGSNEGSF